MTKTIYTYFIHYAVALTNGSVTELSAVNDFDFKLESKDNIERVIKILGEEINTQLLLQGARAHSILIKNFILMKNEIITLNIVNN